MATELAYGRQFSQEPRWPAIVGLLAVGCLNLAVPEQLSLGPKWMLLAVTSVLLIPTTISRRMGRGQLHFALGVLISVVLTVFLIWSLLFLIAGIPGKREEPSSLLRSAVLLWASNILVFASWYWRLDAGGPYNRDLQCTYTRGAFLFPQMTLPEELKVHGRHWKPGFVDYLFLAFNTSTAFSPTDTPVLTRWAKLLTMVQSCISLATIAILAARAIGAF